MTQIPIPIPMTDGLVLAGILFALGLTSLLVRRNLIFVLMSLEVMLNAAALAFVVAGSRWHQADGQVVFMFILAMAAAEVSVGLALVVQIYRRFQSLDVDELSEMRG
ncbi:MAG: NADH-quinone oxidoreductase subunit NuoK [Terriglobales bacterium]